MYYVYYVCISIVLYLHFNDLMTYFLSLSLSLSLFLSSSLCAVSILFSSFTQPSFGRMLPPCLLLRYTSTTDFINKRVQ